MLFGAYAGFLGAYYGDTQWPASAPAWLAGMRRLAHHGRPLRLARPRPDRRRHRDHARGRGHHERGCSRPSSARAIRAWARPRRSRSRCSTGCPIVGIDALRPAARRLPRPHRHRCRWTWMFRRTNIGLNLRAAGEKPEALDAAGVSVFATRSYAVLATGSWPASAAPTSSIVGAGALHAVHQQGQGSWPSSSPCSPAGARCGSCPARSCSALAVARRLAADVGITHLDRLRPHAPLRRHHRRAGPLRPPGLSAARPRAALRARHSIWEGALDARSRLHPERRPDDGVARACSPRRRQITYHYDPAFIEAFRRTERKVGGDLPHEERHPAHAGRGDPGARGGGARRSSGRVRLCSTSSPASSARAWATG